MLLDLPNFTLQRDGVDDHSIADEVLFALSENATGNGVQDVLTPIKLQGVTRIWATLKTGNDVVLRGQYIHDLPLSFIAPLEPEQNVNFHWS